MRTFWGDIRGIVCLFLGHKPVVTEIRLGQFAFGYCKRCGLTNR